MIEKVNCPKCNKHMTKRTNIHHKKEYAYLCSNCGNRVEYDNYKELEEMLKHSQK